jgi:predicted lipid-binding transport protein (Tim44 family)
MNCLHALNRFTWRLLVLLGAPTALLVGAVSVYARVGGGQSYSGGGGGGGGGGGSGGDDGGSSIIFYLIYVLFDLTLEHPAIGIPIDLLVISVLVAIAYYRFNQAAYATPGSYSSQIREVILAANRAKARSLDGSVEALRHYDPNFSPILFTDFAYALYARLQEARGRHDLATFSAYLSPGAARALESLGPANLRCVTGVIVAASRIVEMSNPDRPKIMITLEFEANYTEDIGGQSTTWYTKEEWTFSRKRDVLSRAPDKLTAIHCPKCGGALEQQVDGSCKHCGVKVVGGDFDWCVMGIEVLRRVNKGPLLTADVPEVGTDYPTILQPNLAAANRRFLALNSGFSWLCMESRIRAIFLSLQEAWTEGRWEKARPFVSDAMFQTQLSWINEYRRQHLRNVLEDVQIERTELAKITFDAFHDAVTYRIFASMIDYTADEQGKVLCGSKSRPRRFSEYWTFIRRRGAKPPTAGDNNCPNCGAALKINMAGVCEYCQGKITNGDFDWVLSRIEQDEAYRG